MNSKIVSIIVLTISLASISMVGISTNISYVMADQHQNGYKNQGQCMKEQREDGVDKKTYKQDCKAMNFNDEEDCVDSNEVLCDDGGDGGGGDGSSGDDDSNIGSNPDLHGCPNNPDGICH